ncbi:hypothetical protein PROFUN_05100 [Planoprotostelium fungivorum]|uniref:Cationic amino acid transporter C-terminal domain-containing protein n=1 Tax=Planoprotostelium fungivorum TaxID=1890364 RepID=A0A2P6NRP9_9EUKA|nr:hypothetical protein PROFUN_05100 [Planoprotostelium fungivorum]
MSVSNPTFSQLLANTVDERSASKPHSEKKMESTPLMGQGQLRRRYWSAYSAKSFFRKQDLQSVLTTERGGDNEVQDRNQLSRTLSVWDLMFYGLAATLGTGIFVTVGQVAQSNAGPSVALSFVFAGIASFFSALCYSEFAVRIPVSGSAYSFAYISLGEVVGWFIGWNLTLEYAISASAVAGGWTLYLIAAVESLNGQMPWILQQHFINDYITISPLSLIIVALCTLILLFGMKESAKFNLVITVINIGVILFFIIYGSFFVETKNLQNFFPYGLSGTWSGVGVVFFSYIGFDSVSTLAAEVKRPDRDLPIGIMGTLTIVTLFYVAVAIVLTGMVPYMHINPDAPLAAAFAYAHRGWASTLIAIGSVTTITATTLTSLVGQPRIFFQMANDGLMFPIFAKTNSKGAPVYGTLITGAISGLIALFFNLKILLDMISIGTLLAFTVVCAGVIILRFQPISPSHPNRKSNRTVYMIIAFFFACLLFASRGKVSFPVTDTWNYVLWGVYFLPVVITFIPLCFLKEDPEAPAIAFKTPLVPLIPCIGIFMNVWFIMSLSFDSIIRLLIWTSIGMAIYLFYGIHHSKLAERDRSVMALKTPQASHKSHHEDEEKPINIISNEDKREYE